MSKHYLGYMHSGRREIFTSAQLPTCITHGDRYKSYRGPMSEVSANYLKYREENGYPDLPVGTTAATLQHLANQDQDFYWQAIRATLNIPVDELETLLLCEREEYNPDSQSEAGYPIFVPAAAMSHA